MFDKRIMRAASFGYIPDSVLKDIIDIKPVMLSDSRMSTRVTLDRVIQKKSGRRWIMWRSWGRIAWRFTVTPRNLRDLISM